MTYEQLMAEGAQPIAPPPPTGAAPSNRGFTYEELMAQGAQPVEVPPPEQFTPAQTFGMHATNVFGLAPVAVGLENKLFEGGNYGTARDAYRARLEASAEQNPKAAIAGKLGALVPETLIGGGAGRVVAGAAKLSGLARAAAPIIEANPLAAATARGLAGGAAYGAAGAGGEAAARGEDILPAAAKGAAVGGGLGAGLGAAGERIAQALHGAPAAQAESLVRGAAEKALPRKQNAVAELLEKELGSGGSKLSHQDIVLEATPALRKIRTHDAAKVEEGVNDLHKAVNDIEATKGKLYAHVDEALGGGVEARKAVDMLRNKAAVQTERPWKRVLEQKAKDLEDQWAVAEVPGLGKKTKRELLDLAAGGDAKKNYANIDPQVRATIDAMPFRFDPAQKIPSKQLREALTISQDEAADALGTLHMTQNAKLKALSQEVLGMTMNRTLHQARGSGLPGINASVDAILAANKRQSTWLRLAEVAAQKQDKLKLNKIGIGLGGHAANAVSGVEALQALHHAVTGDIGGAAMHLGGAALARKAPAILRGAGNAKMDLLSMLQQEAQRGNPRALRLLSAARAGQGGATAAGGAVGGTVASSTAAQQEAQ